METGNHLEPGEGWGGDTWYMNIIRGKASDYFNGDNSIAVYDPPQDNVFNGATTYAKGACILHMLRRMVGMVQGDLLVFYGGLRPVHPCEHRLIYALKGMYVVQDVVHASDVPRDRWHENAHVRKSRGRDIDAACGQLRRKQQQEQLVSLGTA